MDFFIKERDLDPDLRLKIASGAMEGIDELLKEKLSLTDLNLILKNYFDKTKDKISKGFFDEELIAELNNLSKLLEKFQYGVEYNHIGGELKSWIDNVNTNLEELKSVLEENNIASDSVEGKLTGLEINFESTKSDHESKIKTLTTKIDNLIADIEKQITDIQISVAEIQNNIGNTDFSKLSERIKNIENTVDTLNQEEEEEETEELFETVDDEEIKKLFQDDIHINSDDQENNFKDIFVTVPNSRVKELFEKILVIDEKTDTVLLT